MHILCSLISDLHCSQKFLVPSLVKKELMDALKPHFTENGLYLNNTTRRPHHLPLRFLSVILKLRGQKALEETILAPSFILANLSFNCKENINNYHTNTDSVDSFHKSISNLYKAFTPVSQEITLQKRK